MKLNLTKFTMPLAMLLSVTAFNCNAETQSLDVDYVEDETIMLMQVYQHMKNSGDMDSSLFTPDPSMDTLLEVYDYAFESGNLRIEDNNSDTEDTDSNDYYSIKDNITPGFNTKAQSSECREKAVECALTVIGTPLACASILIGNFTAPLECVGGLALGGSLCSDANDACDLGNSNYLTTQTQFKGTTGGTSVTKTCNDPNRIRKAYFWTDTHHSWGIKIISKIRMYCGDGKRLDFNNNFGDAGSGKGSSCGNGKQMQGFNIRYGSLIDGAAPRCDKTTDTTTTDWIGSYRGDPNGGTAYTMICPEGRYMYGMRAYHGNGPNTGVNYINGFNLLCRP
jgi:hypothetical protein